MFSRPFTLALALILGILFGLGCTPMLHQLSPEARAVLKFCGENGSYRVTTTAIHGGITVTCAWHFPFQVQK